MPPFARYTRFVGLTKVILGIAILLTLGLVVVIPILNKDSGGMRIMFSNIPTGEAETPSMAKPEFRGFDANNQPYTVTADQAVMESVDVVSLTHLNADIEMKGGKWLSLTSQTGRLDLKAKTVIVNGDVNVFYDNGYEFTTEQMQIDIESKTAKSNVSVTAQGPLGTLTAVGFTALQNEGRIIFTGPVRLIIYPGKS